MPSVSLSYSGSDFHAMHSMATVFLLSVSSCPSVLSSILCVSCNVRISISFSAPYSGMVKIRDCCLASTFCVSSVSEGASSLSFSAVGVGSFSASGSLFGISMLSGALSGFVALSGADSLSVFGSLSISGSLSGFVALSGTDSLSTSGSLSGIVSLSESDSLSGSASPSVSGSLSPPVVVMLSVSSSLSEPAMLSDSPDSSRTASIVSGSISSSSPVPRKTVWLCTSSGRAAKAVICFVFVLFSLPDARTDSVSAISGNVVNNTQTQSTAANMRRRLFLLLLIHTWYSSTFISCTSSVKKFSGSCFMHF